MYTLRLVAVTCKGAKSDEAELRVLLAPKCNPGWKGSSSVSSCERFRSLSVLVAAIYLGSVSLGHELFSSRTRTDARIFLTDFTTAATPLVCYVGEIVKINVASSPQNR